MTTDGPIFFFNEPARTAASIATFSKRDGDVYEGFEDLLDRAASFLRPMMLREPPALGSRHPGDLLSLLREGARGRRPQPPRRARPGPHLHDVGRRPARRLVRARRRSRARSPRPAWSGSGPGPRTPGTAYNLLHHALGEIDGISGGWGQVIGGMGAISQAIARSAEAAGAEIRTGAEVASIDVRNGRAVGVTLADGEEIRAPIVASGAHPKTTILDLAGAENFPDEVAEDMRRYRTRGGSVKINMVLSEPPRLRGRDREDAAHARPTGVNLCPSIDYLERAWQDALGGLPAAEPYVEGELPSAIDSSLTDDGRWVMTMFTQYGPPERGGVAGGRARALRRRLHRAPRHGTRPTCPARSWSARCSRRRTSSESSASSAARSSRVSRASTRWRSCAPRRRSPSTRRRSTASTSAAPAPTPAAA